MKRKGVGKRRMDSVVLAWRWKREERRKKRREVKPETT